jgi:hypothetical protein
MPGTTYKTTQSHNPQNYNYNYFCHCENLKFQTKRLQKLLSGEQYDRKKSDCESIKPINTSEIQNVLYAADNLHRSTLKSACTTDTTRMVMAEQNKP